ncbi:twin-arginine translocase TatA/TatE family subunit [Sphingobacterium thalpophilum]|uniref:Sec-independent protein translocase protein TatA n=1 Tax=Sphingobacterium thalpophilum TaxID=259 RepID=A0A4U9V787_9SPHI|nr:MULTISPECIES: twin-arginine translocase TatA/TatE family subunit [Sphingobacterium]MCW8312727.1 twin-arginine translocase TatA/TatE family subunit [Sphingobacterium sp. InxBP1]VTR40889.1 Sec-independent protein translocase protein TatAy [Sphingobacterium thalpophilum]
MSTSLLIMGIGGQELIVIVVILLLLFGGKKIPELMRGLGKGVKEFKEGQKDESSPEKKPEVEDNK